MGSLSEDLGHMSGTYHLEQWACAASFAAALTDLVKLILSANVVLEFFVLAIWPCSFKHGPLSTFVLCI